MLAAEMLSEPVVVPDVYASGASHVEDLGDGIFRTTLYAKQQSLHGGAENLVVCRIIWTMPAILDAIKMHMIALGRRCCGAGLRGDLH